MVCRFNIGQFLTDSAIVAEPLPDDLYEEKKSSYKDEKWNYDYQSITLQLTSWFYYDTSALAKKLFLPVSTMKHTHKESISNKSLSECSYASCFTPFLLSS